MIASITTVTNLELPELSPYITLKRPEEHLQKGMFIAEGEKVFSRLFASPLKIFSALLTPEWFEEKKELLETNKNSIQVFIAGKAQLETIVGFRLHQGIMATAQIPKQITVTEFLEEKKEPALTVLVDGIVNAENMGVLARNCACFGVDALFVLPTSCDPYLRRSVRNSMGNIFMLPVVYISEPEKEIQQLKNSGFTLYAAHPNAQSRDIRQCSFSKKSCIVLGAEGNGISEELLSLCDEFVTIPMKTGIDSLNVASAGAVMLWEASKSAKVL
ncbi:MAG: RNA methyltransferase [Bacteroidetes bacterium]|nr:RNA methyltransferase [Bacteroidota bacterium]